MRIKLTKEQAKHVKSIQWLFTGPRASGRTTLLAYVLIETVLKTGEEVRIIDHYPNIRADMNLASIIDLLIEQNKLPLEITHSGLRLKLK